jgi:hypothetical protein
VPARRNGFLLYSRAMAGFLSRTTAQLLRLIPALGLLVLMVFSLAGCSNNGGECDTCSMDTDCNTGFVCSTFSDGSKRCGSGTGASQCRVR